MFGLGGLELVIIALVVIVGFPFYFIPTIVARVRRHPNFLGVLLLNLLAGWTMLGWIAALVWAMVAPPQPGYAPATDPPATPSRAGAACARCGAPLAAGWAFCPMCGERRPGT